MSVTINDSLLCNLHENMIRVNDTPLFFSSDITFPETIKGIDSNKIHQISWKWSNASKISYYTDGYLTGELVEVKLTDDDWETVVKPFADQWQIEKDRIDQEQEEAEAEWNKFENRKARALTQLNADFETVKDRAHLKSSLGFEADANSTAKENVQGLIEEVGDSTVQFCDYYNQFHELNKSQLETLKSEINQNGQALYAQKWQYRTAIEQCSDNEGLDQVVAGIEFTYMDFTQTEDTGETVTE